MAQSAKYASVRKFYISGNWSKSTVKTAVAKGWITEDEYEAITGEAYGA